LTLKAEIDGAWFLLLWDKVLFILLIFLIIITCTLAILAIQVFYQCLCVSRLYARKNTDQIFNVLRICVTDYGECNVMSM